MTTIFGYDQGGTSFSSYTLGDLLYGNSSSGLSKLSGNTTSTKKLLRSTGSGSVATAPVWDTLTGGDVGLGLVENTALSTWVGSSNITTLGTITSLNVVGKVGIGTTSPTSPAGVNKFLHVAGTTSSIVLGETGGATQWEMFCDGSSILRFYHSSHGDSVSINSSGYTGFGLTTQTALADIGASTTARSSLRIRSGTAPTSPNDGDMWYDGTNLKIRVGATTKTYTLT